MDKEELKTEFYRTVIVDYGYVDLANWEVSKVDTDNQAITFTKKKE